MTAMLDSTGPHLRTLPTGETRRYEFYIRPIIDELVAQGALESKRAGQWRTSRERTIYRAAGGKKLTGDMMDLGYLREAEEAVPVFEALRAERDLTGVTLQLGMPTDFTMAFVTMGAVGGVLRNKKAFTDATVRDIVAIRELAGDDVVIQLEATAELVLMAQTQPLHRLVDRLLGVARGITELAAASPPGTRFGVHLCLGSMNNKARATLRNVRPFVDLANSIVRQWPADRTLTYVHAPFAAGDIPPSANPKFYAPLRDLTLGEGTGFYAGLVHDIPSEAEQLHTLQLIEQALGRPVDGVATACGLGRRPRPIADALMVRANTLATKG
ncbi:hypothetical protein DFR70_1021012 [Nocardia tenerifensis]|uniref:Uncharacterized protein n=2 Tax=Nocardia tenerifensis TaxID=228006 RepID=A0A318K8U4_9NOCA|nr:hypothetical protein DFR70_1021012 [Nocardia tenerifensis]